MTKLVRHFVDVIKNNTYRVIDGDTVEVLLDRGWQEGKLISARLHGIDTPENKKTRLGGEREKLAGTLVGRVTAEWLAKFGATHQLYHSSESKPKYAKRTIARIYAGWPLHDSQLDNCLNDYLLEAGLGHAYLGKKRPAWTVEELDTIIAKAEVLLG